MAAAEQNAEGKYADWFEKLKDPATLKQLYAASGSKTLTEYHHAARAVLTSSAPPPPPLSGSTSQDAAVCAAQATLSLLEAGVVGKTKPSIVPGSEEFQAEFQHIVGMMSPDTFDVRCMGLNLLAGTTFHGDESAQGRKQLGMHDSHAASIRMQPYVKLPSGSLELDPKHPEPSATSRGVMMRFSNLAPDKYLGLGVAEPQRSRQLLDATLLPATSGNAPTRAQAIPTAEQHERFVGTATAVQRAAATCQLAYFRGLAPQRQPSEEAMQLAAENHAHGIYERLVAALLTMEYSLREQEGVPAPPPDPPRTRVLTKLMRKDVSKQLAWKQMPKS